MSEDLHPGISIRLFKEEKCFGPGIAELIRRADELKSLRAAAKSMNMAYSKAWTILHSSEDALGFRLLDLKTGGKNGGGASLTEEGARMLEAYDSFVRKLRDYGNSIFDSEFAAFL